MKDTVASTVVVNIGEGVQRLQEPQGPSMAVSAGVTGMTSSHALLSYFPL